MSQSSVPEENSAQAAFDADFQLKMARNHIKAFAQVTGPEFPDLYERVRVGSMLPIERLYDLYLATRYVDSAGIPGVILEVGVWRGGAVALAALTSTPGRRIVGFDTFEGHLEPGTEETDIWGQDLHARWSRETGDGDLPWAAVSREEVLSFLGSLGIAPARVDLIQGDIKETAPSWPGEPISILRLDCDWYPETASALERFWPLLSPGGVLICDDYGHHSGQRKAVDEYFEGTALRFTHVDYSCITAVKPG